MKFVDFRKGVGFLRIIIEELETADERYVRIRDDCLEILRSSPNPEERLDAKNRLKDAFEEWWKTL